MNAHEILTNKGFLPYMTKSYSRSIGSVNISCQEMASGFYIFAMNPKGQSLYQATKVQLDELGYYLDKAIRVAKLAGGGE